MNRYACLALKADFFSYKAVSEPCAWLHKCACVIAEKHNQPWHSFNDKSANSIVSESDFSGLVYRRYLHVYYSSCQHSIQFSITNPFCSAAPSFLLPLFLSQLNVIEALAQHIPFAEQLRLSRRSERRSWMRSQSDHAQHATFFYYLSKRLELNTQWQTRVAWSFSEKPRCFLSAKAARIKWFCLQFRSNLIFAD